MTARKEAALTNPSHKVVGPDGAEYFLIRKKGARLRIKILFSTPDFQAGEVSEGWGPSAADGVMMGAWIGPLRHHFGRALDVLPDGTHCVEIGREAGEASLYDYQTDILRKGGDVSNVALRRAGVNVGRYGRAGLPVTRPQIAEAREALGRHRVDLLNGTYRRDDGPMILNETPVIDPAAYRPTYVRAPGSPVPADLLAEFVADVDSLVEYLDFLMTLPPLPERPRTAPASPDLLARLRQSVGYAKPGDEATHAWRLRTLATGVYDPAAFEAAQSADIRARNAATAARRLAAAS
jgi:hypothetical protein